MRFFHLSDLHIGKQLNGYSLRDNQRRVLSRIAEYARLKKPDAILICGDIYDKAAPSGEAVTIFDAFLDELAAIRPQIPVLIIAGNHDSPERLSYASSFLEKHRIYLSAFPPRSGEEYLKKIRLEDEWGPVDFYLLPFLKPGYVRPLFEEGRMVSYEDAVRVLLERQPPDPGVRNVILSHQFYAGGGGDPQICDSETSVALAGGLDRVDASVLDAFDYAALGHLHGAQRVGREGVRYCGSPCKYSVSEEHHQKAVALVNLQEKGSLPRIEFLPLDVGQDVRRIRGTLEQVVAEAKSREGGVCRDFVSITVTDEEEPYRLRERLEEVYECMLELRVDNERTRSRLSEGEQDVVIPGPMEAFRRFFETMRHSPMTEAEEKIMEQVIREVKEE